MLSDPFRLSSDDPAHYCIYAQGCVEPRWLEMLSGIWQISQERPAWPGATILVGRVLDQAALMGDLQQLYCLGLPLLRVECIGRVDAGAEGA